MADSKDNTEAKYHLIGLYTRYSSWTARIELILKYFNLPYTAQFINFPDIPSLSPSGLVPLLRDNSLSKDHPITDSLSIALHLASSHPTLPLFPSHPLLRALALSAICEMHSGFEELRNTYHTNFIARYEGAIPVSEKAGKEIERMLGIWGDARPVTREVLGEEGDGDYLFGEFGVVDAFFWPVLWRFRTYNLPLDSATPEALKWMQKMWSDPVIKEVCKDYFRQAEREEARIEKYEDIFKGNDEITVGRFKEDWEFEVPGGV